MAYQYGGAANFVGGSNFGSSTAFKSSDSGPQDGGGFSNDNPTNTPKKSQYRSGANKQSLLPLTIRQLLTSAQSHTDDIFKVDGRELAQITIVGLITSVHEQSTFLNYWVDDGTGKIEVRLWLDQDDNDFTTQKSAWREGVYVRVVGHLRSFNGVRSIVGFRIQPIHDFNEITFHLLEVIYVHLYNIKTKATNPDTSNTTTQSTPVQTSNYSTGYDQQAQYNNDAPNQIYNDTNQDQGNNYNFNSDQDINNITD